MRDIVRVGIIGAGSAGLAQLKQVLDAFGRPNVQSTLEVVCFEARDEVGGVWLSDMKHKPYLRAELPATSDPDVDQLYFYPRAGDMPSPMYEGLRTNLPYDLMSYRDFPMPPQDELFSDRGRIQQYLEDYATQFSLRRHIRFRHVVDRLYQSADPDRRRWTIEFSSLDSRGAENFDFVCVANGHYADGWIPEIPGLSSFPGQIWHSRYFLRPEDYAGKTVLVVGSFASGGDISRLIASLNLGRYEPDGRPIVVTPPDDDGVASRRGPGFTKVYVSASGTTRHSVQPGDESQPWSRYTTYVPLISHVASPDGETSKGTIHLTDGAEPLTDIDVIIFATGYNFLFPFCKVDDLPWCDRPLLDKTVRDGERVGGDVWEVGGMKGLGVKELDETLVFLQCDRSIAFPVLQYQVVPFPLAEIQTRLTSLLWAGLLPSFPDHPRPPPHPSNPYYTPPETPRSSPPAGQDHSSKSAATRSSPQPPPRKVLSMRQKLVIGASYEWTYTEWLMSLMSEADRTEDNSGYATPEHWRKVEEWRKERRADTTLRKRTLGY